MPPQPLADASSRAHPMRRHDLPPQPVRAGSRVVRARGGPSVERTMLDPTAPIREEVAMGERRPIGNVLVGTDFTRHARDAVVRAAWLPIAPGSNVTLLHALPARMRDDLDERLRATAAALLGVALDAAWSAAGRASLRDVGFLTAVARGPAEEELGRRARLDGAELLVIGRGERRGARERLLGSTAERIVRVEEPCVLVVGADPRGRYLRPLLAVDLADVARRAAEWALRLCDPGVRELPVLHAWDAPHLPLLRLTEAEASRYVADEESVATARLGAWLARHRDLDARLERVLRRGDPRDAILDEAERRAADLIVIGARRRSGIGGLLVGRVAESVVRHASCDVLVVR